MENKEKLSIKNFFKDNIKIIMICAFAVIFINIIDIATIKFGIDSEHAAILGTGEMFKLSGRFGLYLLNMLFPAGSYQIISQVLGIFILIITGLIIIYNYNFNSIEKILFIILFVTYPSIAFMQYYYFQSFYIFFSVLLTVISYRLIENNNIEKIIGIIILTFSLSVFQGNIAVFLTIMMIDNILNYLLLRVSFNQSIKKIIKTTTFLVIAVLLYFAIQYVVIHYLWGTDDKYHTNMIAYTKENIIDVLGNVFTTIWRIMVSHSSNWEYSAYKYVTITLFISILAYIIYNRNIVKSFIIIVYTLLFILAVFSLEILIGTWIGSRVDIAVGLYGALIILILYHIIQHKFVKNIILLLGFLIILNHSYYIIKYQTASYLTYKQDVITASIILKDLYREYPDIYTKKYKIITYGKLESKSSSLFEGKENFGLSQFAFPFEEYRTDYIINFLKLSGLPKHIEVLKDSIETRNILEKMPVFPEQGYIKRINDIIIIKLR